MMRFHANYYHWHRDLTQSIASHLRHPDELNIQVEFESNYMKLFWFNIKRNLCGELFKLLMYSNMAMNTRL